MTQLRECLQLWPLTVRTVQRWTLRSVVISVMLVVLLSGCGLCNRFIFSSSTEMIACPDQYGMSYREVRFLSENGISLHGWMIPGDPGKQLVLYFHGNAANISHRIDNLQYLNDLGLSVFIFDYRGFGESEGVPCGENNLYRDARQALAYLNSRGWHTSQIIYYGRSMGAAVALQLALDEPPARLVLESPFTSLHDVARAMMPFSYATFGWWMMEEQFMNLEKISQVKVPLLMIHGDQDQVVPLRMSWKLFAHAPQPKRLLVVPGARHSDAFLVGGDAYRQAWLNLIVPTTTHAGYESEYMDASR